MSHPHSQLPFDHRTFDNKVPLPRIAGETSSPEHAMDRAIDTALRRVPLPEGLLTRLGVLVHAMPDETTNKLDCLGC